MLYMSLGEEISGTFPQLIVPALRTKRKTVVQTAVVGLLLHCIDTAQILSFFHAFRNRDSIYSYLFCHCPISTVDLQRASLNTKLWIGVGYWLDKFNSSKSFTFVGTKMRICVLVTSMCVSVLSQL